MAPWLACATWPSPGVADGLVQLMIDNLALLYQPTVRILGGTYLLYRAECLP